LIVFATTSLLIIGLLYLAVNTDRDPHRLKTMSINGRTVIKWRILVPHSWANRRVGLLNTISIPPYFGLLIASSTVHTKGMLCDIDLVGLDDKGRVTGVHESVAPNIGSVKMPRNTKNILELAIGSIRSLGIQPNDSLIFGDIK